MKQIGFAIPGYEFFLSCSSKRKSEFVIFEISNIYILFEKKRYQFVLFFGAMTLRMLR